MGDTELLLTVLLAGIYTVSFYCIYQILMSYRMAQSAVAWILGLLTFPFITLILYALFGRNRLAGYVRLHRAHKAEITDLASGCQRLLYQHSQPLPSNAPELALIAEVTESYFLGGNRLAVLQDGEQTYQALFDAIDSAQHYILFEYYIVRNDRVGKQLQERLIQRLADGVKVLFIYDEIGSANLPSSYLRALTNAGAYVLPFGSLRKRPRRLQINFRNHRKLLICDGKVGFLGGLNLGDEYLGIGDMGQWRDTHCRMQGPVVLALQYIFAEDWCWASDADNKPLSKLNWQIQSHPANQNAMLVATGPADYRDAATLTYLTLINNSRQRLWIASPYFVPDQEIMSALHLASLRGVDVRIMLPQKPDHWVIAWAAYSYIEEATKSGIAIYRYQPGFMHQKVWLSDDRYAGIGSANLDNRSLRLNFEFTLISTDPQIIATISDMLARDFAHSRQQTLQDYLSKPLIVRVAARASRLLAPIL